LTDVQYFESLQLRQNEIKAFASESENDELIGVRRVVRYGYPAMTLPDSRLKSRPKLFVEKRRTN
jgi:hypothetical protein